MPQTEANLRLAETGDLDGLRRLIAHAPNLLDARAARPPNLTLLTTAAASGQHAAVDLLLKGGASVNATDGYEGTPLLRAARGGHIDCVSTLCEAGAAVDAGDKFDDTPLTEAVVQNHLECAKLLSSYGASRLPDRQGQTPEEIARVEYYKELLEWLQRTRAWTPLHHLEQLTRARAVALLRGGADVHAGSPSPLERAREVGGEVSELVVRAAGPWSPEAHELFPAAERERAAAVLRTGYLLAWAPEERAKGAALIDVWRWHVLPHAVERGCWRPGERGTSPLDTS